MANPEPKPATLNPNPELFPYLSPHRQSARHPCRYRPVEGWVAERFEERDDVAAAAAEVEVTDEGIEILRETFGLRDRACRDARRSARHRRTRRHRRASRACRCACTAR